MCLLYKGKAIGGLHGNFLVYYCVSRALHIAADTFTNIKYDFNTPTEMQGKGKAMLASSVLEKQQIKMFGKHRTKFSGKIVVLPRFSGYIKQ